MNTSVKSAGRVLDILELFASTDRALALRDVARILELPKSSAHMLLSTLTARGYLVRTSEDLIRLAPAMDQGGWVGGIAGQIFRAAQPHLDRLVREQEESLVLGAPTPGLDVRLLSHRISPQAIRYDVTNMPVIPGWCTAMGNAILSHLPEDRVRSYLETTDRQQATPQTVTDVDAILRRLSQQRARGHALNIDERFEGASGAAVPICGPDGQPYAALNCVTVTPRFLRKQTAIVAALKAAAAEIEAEVFGKTAKPSELSA
ncbi:MAG: IclR family transcriptional regulator [Paracoccaceae bacterium]